MKKSTLLVHGSALLAMFFWGISYIWSKQVFEHLQPATTVFFRLLISVPFLFLLISLLKQHEKIQRQHYPIFILSAVFNPFLYFMGESFGLNLVSPTISAVIIATIPLFTPVFAFAFLRERLSRLNITGLLISFIGILVMLLQKNLSFAASPLGIMYLFGAVLAAVAYGLLLKKLTSLYSSTTIVLGQNFIGIFFFLPIVYLFEKNQLSMASFQSDVLIPLLMLGVFASSLAFILFTYAVGKLGIARSNIYTNMIPVFTAFFSFLLLGEIITFDKMIGVVLVIFGVAVSQYKPKRSISIQKS